MLDIKTLENWLWDAACKIRGEIDAPKYKDYILPLIFLKRLSDVFDDEVEKFVKDYPDEEKARKLIEDDHNLVIFYIPEKARWSEILKQTTNLGEYLTDAVRSIAKENPKLQGVIDIVDFNATQAGQRIITDEKLKSLIDTLNKYRLGLKDVEPDILGRAYEYLLRKFAEGSGQSAGEFYTPGEVAMLMAHIIDPKPGETIYDPCLGSGGLLIKCYLRFREKYNENPRIEPLKFYGQEILHSTYAMARMNAFVHQMEAEIALGDTMIRPHFTTPTGALEKFDIVVSNPMWNQDFQQSVYENDAYNRFTYGYPPSNSADWGWVQHMLASLNENGRMAVVLDTGSVSRGSGNAGSNRERDIRKKFVENDFIESVILLPENLFYNTTAPGIILIINKNKAAERKNKVLLINASKLFEKGRPKNFLPDSTIKNVSDVYHQWKEEEGISKIISNEEIARNDYNLSPSRYVSQNGGEEILPLEEAIIELKEAEEQRKEAEEKLKKILKDLGI
ncbi:MAG TPA: class I SAM-dependent DNA methyltransferase [Candidatus Ratteibacteria bacterium]|jgi:type I restriction enzyme M protein|uniref:site-specific DNA-methyltransferase (adenine-specific) n=1 Tax=candidate division TA06 bacterium ADurb.Bin131 TaxID=1852827 RepID=A0A1V6C920_UNCT6|nr:MAG: Type I restriction enzyme EcoKI M protein [candidate division TA06 bacterium ADurb.Bin131]HRS07054.1 class I SAM-dependent DNA methyltransferase [Candidatus Ratteibacteria bacterium]HRV05089.1 class I SAM-dependent DNA methyltransferase [Candidatus Ratteibacteria bacterium]